MANEKLGALVAQFMKDVLESVRSEVHADLVHVLSQPFVMSGPTADAPAAPRNVARLRKAATAAHEPARKAKAKGEKRTPAELDAQCGWLLGQIKRTPGDGIEAISKALGVSTSELSLPVKKLLAEKSIRTKGHKRATKYYPR